MIDANWTPAPRVIRKAKALGMSEKFINETLIRFKTATTDHGQPLNAHFLHVLKFKHEAATQKKARSKAKKPKRPQPQLTDMEEIETSSRAVKDHHLAKLRRFEP